MREIRQLEGFSEWLRSLAEGRARAKIVARIDRLRLGNAGDVAPIGEGMSEMRVNYGPGYRVYFIQRGDTATLLCGGDKSSQSADISLAKRLANDLEE